MSYRLTKDMQIDHYKEQIETHRDQLKAVGSANRLLTLIVLFLSGALFSIIAMDLFL